jgi:hypothetical protein
MLNVFAAIPTWNPVGFAVLFTSQYENWLPVPCIGVSVTFVFASMLIGFGDIADVYVKLFEPLLTPIVPSPAIER